MFMRNCWRGYVGHNFGNSNGHKFINKVALDTLENEGALVVEWVQVCGVTPIQGGRNLLMKASQGMWSFGIDITNQWQNLWHLWQAMTPITTSIKIYDKPISKFIPRERMGRVGPQGSVTPPNQDKHLLIRILRMPMVQLSQNKIIK